MSKVEKEKVSYGEKLPNKACSRLVGFAATYGHFPRSKRILLSSLYLVPPTSG